ncbi:dihydrofolate reductase family protein [Listeria costaricensis]|uniref:dihydrofolate reductase family protein n=1 Tax=Listeria costaricensis TaxID=2026604 RepID=UPI000C077AC4|nr:dihydrofolate reductase family protein [Listeria costaricensis]
MSIYFYGCITLDGYLADKNHQLDWLYETGSPEETSYDAFYAQMDITIMGKKTFDEIADLENLADFYGGTKNYVFTHQQALSSDLFTPVSGDVVSFVRSLPADKNIWIVGGNQILAPLLDLDLVDQLVLQFAPVLLGDGVPLFTQKEAFKRFTLKEIHQYGPFAELVLEK